MNRRGHCFTVSICVALAWLLAVAGEPARAQTAGVAATATASPVPPMFGDWVEPEPLPRSNGTPRLQPLATTYSAFKVAENESPLPTDRLFVTYNFYSRVLGTQDIHRETLGVEKTFLGATRFRSGDRVRTYGRLGRSRKTSTRDVTLLVTPPPVPFTTTR